MKYIFGLIVLFLVGCELPVPQQTADTTNKGYQVDLLFQHDGCKVYRFADHSDYRYFVKCEKGNDSTAADHICGKSCINHEEIETVK